MLKALGSRLTYANVVATGALFVALGGGAYALSGVPDRGGVFHGCVSNRTGVLRVVKGASSCRSAKGRGKHRDPGELAVSWNQTGRPGANGRDGANGANGANGGTGPQGPGATAFSTALPADSASHTLTTVGGLKLSGICTGSAAALNVDTAAGGNTLKLSGTGNSSSTVVTLNADGSAGVGLNPASSVSMDVIARDTASGNFMRLDLHGQGPAGGNCDYWGMITPTS